MKKIFNFAMMGAIALTGAMTFTACSSDDEAQAPVNPTFDGESVKTTFTISVGDVKGGTRMAADAVQADNTFKGMTDIYLFPSKGAITSSKTFDQGYINLPEFNAFDVAATPAGELETAQAKRYKDVSFALGVDHFLFYAATATSNKDNGELKPSYLKMEADAANFVPAWDVTPNLTTASTPANIKFDLVPYQKGKSITDVQTAGETTVKALNDVYLKLKEEATAASTAVPARTTIASRLNHMCDSLKNPNWETSSTYEPFAGSALSIQELIEDIYNSLFVKNASTTLTGEDLTDYTTYIEPVLSVITGKFTVEDNTTTIGHYDLTWTTANDFPKTALGLPDGAVAVKFNAASEATKPFDYVEADADGMAVATMDNYVHPARLYYTINTTSMVKTAPYLYTTDVTGKAWTAIQAEYTDGAVAATTQSVIMKDQVQYAVGRLDVQAQVKTGVTIKDNGSGIPGAADKDPQPVVVPSAGYTLTGVLIGGQKQVDWEFHPIDAATEMTIYDGKMTTASAAAKSGELSDVNHTLALETKASTPVNVALEFVNTGNDFYGKDHKVIPAGSKFYLVARLNPGTSETANPDGINQVIKQDYTTTAKFTINDTSLASAYNIIPDLRSPKLEFGLSVDLKWKTGITFEQEF